MITGCYVKDCIDSNGTFTKPDIASLEMSPFKLNATIESILNNLMIEEYASHLSYEKYYNECSLLLCTYSYVKSHDAGLSLISLHCGLVIITSLI